MQTLTFNQLKTVTLAREHVYFGGMQLAYRLFAYRRSQVPCFAIGITKDSEAFAVEVVGDLSRALHCFEEVVRGKVTPFGLEDFLKNCEDL